MKYIILELQQFYICRDLKGDNILLDNLNTIKVSDFGFARPCKSKELVKTFAGCISYAPPELLLRIPYPGPAHDIWSMGMILYQMVSNQTEAEEFSQTFTIVNGTIHIHD